jgi:putative membrane protein
MRHLILRLIINAIALFVATQVRIPGLSFTGDWITIVIVAFIFGLVNALIRPLLTILTCPLIVLTFWFIHICGGRRDAGADRLDR